MSQDLILNLFFCENDERMSWQVMQIMHICTSWEFKYMTMNCKIHRGAYNLSRP